MSQSAHEIAQVLQEIAIPLQGGWIQKIYQPGPLAVTLEIRIEGETLHLHISAHPQIPRLHLLTQKYANPSSPPQFCQFLRRHLQGAKVVSIEQVTDDRIVRLRYQKTQDTGSLMADLIGRGANLYLLDANDTVSATLRSGRLAFGDHYELPFGESSSQQHRATEDTSEMSQPADAGAYPINRGLEARYAQLTQDLVIQRAQQAYLSSNTRKIKKAKRRLAGLEADLLRMDRYKDYRQYGELLKAAMHAIPKGATQATVQDYFDPSLGSMIIPLDPSLSANENMNTYFRKFRKYCSAQRELLPRIEAIPQELASLAQERDRLLQGIPPPDVDGLVSTALPRSPGKKVATRKRSEKIKLPYRHFVSLDGLIIGVGRNATENEALTFRAAKGRDLWLHARGVPGSHVAVFMGDWTTVPPQTLYDAAHLALLYSDRKRSGHGDVSYTLRKYVKKVKGKPPGTVTMTQEKNLYVELDETRLNRLKGSET
ncbi:MAG TPA: fibronectin-binding domain-containing protein [Nitrospirales bacterium]|nr:fibronectin-binding domain-containing protein [Nitrospirales bacterium]